MPNFSLPDSVFESAAARFPTPFHLYDEQGIRERARRLKAAFAWCPDFREYFAVKALPNPAILRILGEEGCGLDCSSATELMLAERGGFRGDQIMFSANAMPPEEYDQARALGAFINLDDLSDVELLAAHGGIPETVCLRYNPGGDFSIGNTIMGNPGEAKYGMPESHLLRALFRLKELSANSQGGACHETGSPSCRQALKSFGLHAFLSSNTMAPTYYPELARILLRLGKHLSAETGLRFAFINLSGGIGIPYQPDQPEVDVQAVGDAVRQVYAEECPSGNVAVKSELGRWMTGPCGWLVTHAIHEKKIHRDYIGVDACAADLMRPAMYGAYHHITVCGKRTLPADHLYDVTGCLCENNDKFAVQRPLPETVPGDLLVIHDTGAHGHAMGYNYNGRLRSAEVLRTLDGSFRLIRRAETPEDYFATLNF